MSAPQTALLLIGSPKPGASSSESLGSYLCEELETRGVKTQAVKLVKALRSEEATEALRTAVAGSDLIVLSFPLYIDSLPAPTILALEQIAAWSADVPGHRPAFVAVCQSGFPEVEQNKIALEICRNFAAAAGFEWAGGLILAAGGMVSGQPLRKIKGRMRSAVAALDLTAGALAAGQAVPDQAVRLMARPSLPRIAYRFMANWGWRWQLKREAGGTPLDAQPFA